MANQDRLKKQTQESKMKERELKKQKRFEKFPIKAVALFSFVVALFILIVINSIHPKQDCKLFDIYIKPITTTLAMAIITMSVGTLVLDFYGYVNYTRKRIAEVFTEKELVNILDDSYKQSLKTKLLQSIYQPNTGESDALVTLFDKRIGELLSTYYYSSYDVDIDCTLCDDHAGHRYIEKRIRRTVMYKEINSDKENNINTFLRISFLKTIPDPCIIKQVKVDGKEYKIENDYLFEKDEKPGEKLIRYIVKPKQYTEIKNELHVVIEYTTKVPISDRQYIIKIDHLCKQMSCNINFDPNEFEVAANGFMFTTTPKDFSHCSTERHCKISTESWLLPGEGVVFSITEKNSS